MPPSTSAGVTTAFTWQITRIIDGHCEAPDSVVSLNESILRSWPGNLEARNGGRKSHRQRQILTGVMHVCSGFPKSFVPPNNVRGRSPIPIIPSAGASTARARRPTRSSTKTTTSSRSSITSIRPRRTWWEVHVVIIPKKWVPTLLDFGLATRTCGTSFSAGIQKVAIIKGLYEKGFMIRMGVLPPYQHTEHVHIHILSGKHKNQVHRRRADARCQLTRRPRPEPRNASLLDIALTFAAISSTAFGGGQKASIRHQVTSRGWMDTEGFMDGLELAQVLPGPNILNLAIYCGQKSARTSRRDRSVSRRERAAVPHRPDRRRALLQVCVAIHTCTARCADAPSARSGSRSATRWN